MLDLGNQIRTYYETTTVSIDIESIAVDGGTVLVGPFPDAVQKRGKRIGARLVQRRGGPRVAVATFTAIVVAVAGTIAVANLLDGDERSVAGDPERLCEIDQEFKAWVPPTSLEEARERTRLDRALHEEAERVAPIEILDAIARTNVVRTTYYDLLEEAIAAQPEAFADGGFETDELDNGALLRAVIAENLINGETARAALEWDTWVIDNCSG